MSKQGLVRLLPRNEVENPSQTQDSGEVDPKRWIGRIAIFEMVTGTRVQGKILAMSDEWIDTDNGGVRVEHIVHARWVSAEEAAIIRNDTPLLGGRGW
jgi:hypothetical protein